MICRGEEEIVDLDRGRVAPGGLISELEIRTEQYIGAGRAREGCAGDCDGKSQPTWLREPTLRTQGLNLSVDGSFSKNKPQKAGIAKYFSGNFVPSGPDTRPARFGMPHVRLSGAYGGPSCMPDER
jgi:hypothetical protein